MVLQYETVQELCVIVCYLWTDTHFSLFFPSHLFLLFSGKRAVFNKNTFHWFTGSIDNKQNPIS